MRSALCFIIIVCAGLAFFHSASFGTVPASFGDWPEAAIAVLALVLWIDGVRVRKLPVPNAAVKSEAPLDETKIREAARAAALQEAKAEKDRYADAQIAGFLRMLQEKGRFLDFLMDDITPHDDAIVGRAARVVHQGCSPLLREYFAAGPVHGGAEGETLTISAERNPAEYRLIGRAANEPPFTGRVMHRGWRAEKMALPRVTNIEPAAGGYILAPIELEVRS